MGKPGAAGAPQTNLAVYPQRIEAGAAGATFFPPRSFLRKSLSALRIFAINLTIFAVLRELASLIYINVTKWPGIKPSFLVGSNGRCRAFRHGFPPPAPK